MNNKGDPRDRKQSSNTTNNDALLKKRRATVKRILAVGGVAGGSAIPMKWGRPVVDSVFLPAHAQTSGAPPSRSSFFDVTFNFDGSRSSQVQVSGTVTPNGNAAVDPASDMLRVADALVKPAHAAFNPAEALAKRKVRLLVTLQVNRQFHYEVWDFGNALYSDGPHGPFDQRFGSEVVRIDTKRVIPEASGTWTVTFDNVTVFNQPTQSFPPEVNNFTNYVHFNNQPSAGKQTFIEFPAFPLTVNVAFADTPDMVAATGDTLNPYVSPLSFGVVS